MSVEGLRRRDYPSLTVRRGTTEPARPTVVTAEFTVDLAAGRVTKGGQDVRLTPTEWHLTDAGRGYRFEP